MTTTHAPAPTPKSILRGHDSQVHAAVFVRHNQRLATGDAAGFVVLWDLSIRRPTVVWRAHSNAILGIADWDGDKIITHGRDNRLIVWKVAADDEAALSTSLPLDRDAPPRPTPWVLHILEVNTMNFCSFASCPVDAASDSSELLIAVPNTLSSESVDIYHLPSQKRECTVRATESADDKIGMAMALSLVWLGDVLTLIAAYENGMTLVAQRVEGATWEVVYKAQTHNQPILSLDVASTDGYFLTSGADALIVKHPLPGLDPKDGSKGQDSAGKSEETPKTGASGPSMLSAALVHETETTLPAERSARVVQSAPLKVLNTKHSGQQSIRIRDDGKIFATAGWDSKVRVYSAKTMSELAVLKWHETGCLAVAFAATSRPDTPMLRSGHHEHHRRHHRNSAPDTNEGSDRDTISNTEMIITAQPGDMSVKERRIRLAKETHWLAAGSKDGKISLWDIY